MTKIGKLVKLLREQGAGGLSDKLRRKAEEIRRRRWFRKKAGIFHLITEEERARQIEESRGASVKFSVVTPLYNTPRRYLEEMLESLERQTYPCWELCLADSSDGKHTYVRDICLSWSQRDPRILYTRLEENRGISGNTNACLALAGGQYIGLLDHDDVLHESALYEMAKAVREYDADFLYSDEAKFSGKIEDAIDFNFKPDFGKDELRSHNYICHFTVFDKGLLDKLGEAFRPAFDGSQDHDMVLRLTEKAERIVHIPKVLYYWRVHQNSVSGNLDSKGYAVDAAVRAVQEQLERTGERGEVSCNLPYRTIYRTRYDIPVGARVTVVVHGLDSQEEFETYSRRLKELSAYTELDVVPALSREGQSLGRALDQAADRCAPGYIIFMSARCLPVNSTWIEELLMFAARQDVAAVGPKVLYEDDTVAYAGIAVDRRKRSRIRFLCERFPDSEQGYEAILRYVRDTTAVWKGCFMIEKEMFFRLGGFGEAAAGYEDVDLSLRAAAAGLLNVWTCFAVVRYAGDSMDDLEKGDVDTFAKDWEDVLRVPDRYYHENWRRLKLV